MFTHKPTQVRWLIVAMLTGFTFLAHFNRVSISVAANEHFIGDGKLTAEQMGAVYSAFLFVYTLGMLPGGWVLDRIGPRWAMTALGLGFGALTIATGLLGHAGLAVPALFLPLLVIRGVAGATSVFLHPGAARSVSLWLPASQRITANGLVTAGALVGVACTYPLFGGLMDVVGWPTAFVISGGALAALGAVWFLLSSDDPIGHPWANAAERAAVRGNDPPARTSATLADIAELLRNRGLILLTLSYGAVGYVQYLFFYWIEYYFKDVLKLPPGVSRNAAFTITMAMAVGMAAGGGVSDWACRKLGPTAGSRVMAVGGMSLGAAFSLLGVSRTDPDEIMGCFALALGSIGLCEGLFWTTAPALESRAAGLACAVVNTGGNGIGILAPLVTPILAGWFGWTVAIAVACGVLLLGAALWLGIRAPVRAATARER